MFSIFPPTIAAFFKLENATSYTGHCFRRTSKSLLAYSGAKIDVLKRHGGWKSSNVVEGYVEPSIKNKQNISDKTFWQVADLSSMDVRSSSSLSPPISAALSEQTTDRLRIFIVYVGHMRPLLQRGGNMDIEILSRGSGTKANSALRILNCKR
ncbi:hypothetical protein NQ317_001576 [Molorchus minor]|uniref:Tyr recombinase domain-containing protein n=1 Tax=Molorchus minor TaxID=1323400 RepID=A0ABQ9J5I3_9CUCU|nr:hypothetical protein NQ317_001576 [Molorchus minor]